MIFIFTGCLAFILFYIFDFNKIIFLKKYINICFATGIVFLAASTVGILLDNHSSLAISIPLKLLYMTLSVGSLLLLSYALFVAIPSAKTYLETERGDVIDRGMYALCRHPGVIWFFMFYLFAWLASGKMMIMMWAGIVWTVMDIIYAYVEDRWIFPKSINGYARYKLEVPFLIPNLASIQKSIITSI
jgi:protein-S-isoprenylcysteine O-methyltransferase Ste14